MRKSHSIDPHVSPLDQQSGSKDALQPFEIDPNSVEEEDENRE
jgi:hypothetical protein